VVGAVFAAVYYVAPYVYQEYIQPVQKNTMQIDNMTGQLELIDQKHNDQLDDMLERMDVLEVQNDTVKQEVGGLKGRLTEVENQQDIHEGAFSGFEHINTELEQLHQDFSDIRVDLEELSQVQKSIEADIESLENTQINIQKDHKNTNTTLEEVQTQIELLNGLIARTELEVHLLRVMELVTRARFNLVQENLSLARTDLEDARDILLEMKKIAEPFHVENISEITSRLEKTLDLLAGSPLLAADQLEAVWQLLVLGMPIDSELSSTPQATAEVTPQVTPPSTQ
jgi:chromosome segregation ATPase